MAKKTTKNYIDFSMECNIKSNCHYLLKVRKGISAFFQPFYTQETQFVIPAVSMGV